MKMRKQRLMGLALVAIAALVVVLASTGETPEDRDATAALLIGPLGVYMMATKEYVLYDGDEEPESTERQEEHGEALPGQIINRHIAGTARKESQHGKNARY